MHNEKHDKILRVDSHLLMPPCKLYSTWHVYLPLLLPICLSCPFDLLKARKKEEEGRETETEKDRETTRKKTHTSNTFAKLFVYRSFAFFSLHPFIVVLFYLSNIIEQETNEFDIIQYKFITRYYTYV